MHYPTWRHSLSILLAATAVWVSAARPAAAQVYRIGTTNAVVPTVTLGNDTAFDPVNHVYLVIGAQGPLMGTFVNESGAPVSAAFTINDPALFAQYPRVVYSPEVNGTGGFLVVWHSGDLPGGLNQVHARTVAYGSSPALGQDVVAGFSSPTGSQWTAGPAVAFSTTSHRFLVAWQTYATYLIHGVLLSPTGQPVSGVFQISGDGDGGRDPGVAWNPNKDEFGVSFSGWNAQGTPSASMARVRASDGAVMRRTVVEYSAGSFITDITFSTTAGNFVMAWAAPLAKTASISGDGDVIKQGLSASSVGTYDGLSLAYNPVSDTILMVGQYTAEVGGVELDRTGSKIGVEQEVTAGQAKNGSFYPRVTANTTAKAWNVSFSFAFAAAAQQVVGTATGGGGPVDSDGDGVPDSVDQCPNTFAQTANGCPGQPPPPPPPPVDSDGDGVTDNLDPCPSLFAQTANGCPVAAPMNGNFTGQNESQVVFVHKSTGSAYLWTLSNGNYTGGGWLHNANDPGWKVVGTSDMTGDGLSDILWQNQQTGAVRLFKMAYFSQIGEQTVGLQVGDPNWRIAATGDFNNDGQADIVWQHLIAGNIVIWFMKSVNGQAVFQSAAYVTVAPGGSAVALGSDPWRIVGTSDFDGDGYCDIAFENAATGQMTIWGLGARTQAGVPIIRQQSLGAVNPIWQIKTIANFAGDANADALFQNTSTGQLYLWVRSGNGFVPFGFVNSPAAVWEASGPR